MCTSMDIVFTCNINCLYSTELDSVSLGIGECVYMYTKNLGVGKCVQ